MSLIHLARQGFITKSALPNVTRQRGTTTGTANLMLYGAGKDFAIGTNTTFTDSSTNNFTVTRNGDTIQATNNPFTGSVYFDGNGDYLTVPNNTALNPGTGDFTLEVWVYFNTLTQGNIFDGNTNGMSLALNGSNQISFGQSNVAYLVTDTVAMTTGSWFHIVAVRSGTTLSLFKNGSRVATATNSSNFTTGTINRIGWNGFSAYFDGYLSNLRIVKGTAVYSPSSTTITVPTSPLTAITNTQLLLLTAQQAPFRDSSSNNFTVTANGNAAGSGLEPFPVNYAGSAYFDGTGDYLTVTNSAALQLTDATAFTIECWVYPTNLTSPSKYIFENFNSSSPFQGYGLAYNINSTNAVEWWDGGGTWANTGITLTTNEWTHIAVTYEGSGTTRRFFKNGVLSGSAGTVSSSINYTAGACSIGAQEAGNSPWFGYISNLRIIKGTAQYTAAFTPPAAPLTAVTNTSLLLLTNNVGPFVDTSANGFPVLRNGDTVQTGFSPFTGQPSAGSGYFDGTGDYLSVANNTAFDFGSGNLTIEQWVYPTSLGAERIISSQWFGGTISQTAWTIDFQATNKIRVLIGSGSSTQVTINSTSTFSANNWYHVAVVRSGTTITLYVNGVNEGSVTLSGVINNIAYPIYIGALNNSGVLTSPFVGYISNVRIVKGTALYTSNFTPATAPLPAVPNTSLLLNTDNYTIANSTPTYRAITLSGNTTISTAQYPVGMNRSIAFDGNSDYVQVPNDAAIADFGTGDFTIELFINITSVDSIDSSSNRGATAIATTVGFSGNGWNIDLGGNASGVPNSINFNSRQGGSQIGINANVTMSKTVWYHIAVARSGTVTTIYLDGVSVGSATLSNQTISSTQPIWIGGQNISGYQHWVNGYISNVRIVKGSALYTANFTPPAAPLPLSVTVPNNVTNNIYGVYQLA